MIFKFSVGNNGKTRMELSYAPIYMAYDEFVASRRRSETDVPRNAYAAFLMRSTGEARIDGFKRMQLCRKALDALDVKYQRSFHQRMFHDNFIRACARVFFKPDPAGSFARAHQALLDLNGWDSLAQEILISTPRRCVPYSQGSSFFIICGPFTRCTKARQAECSITRHRRTRSSSFSTSKRRETTSARARSAAVIALHASSSAAVSTLVSGIPVSMSAFIIPFVLT